MTLHIVVSESNNRLIWINTDTCNYLIIGCENCTLTMKIPLPEGSGRFFDPGLRDPIQRSLRSAIETRAPQKTFDVRSAGRFNLPVKSRGSLLRSFSSEKRPLACPKTPRIDAPPPPRLYARSMALTRGRFGDILFCLPPEYRS